MWTEVSYSVPHFLHIVSLHSPMICKCLLNVLCPVSRPVTTPVCVLLKNFIIWNSYIHNCITSPHSCRPHLSTFLIVTLVFVVPRQRTVPPSYAASCWLHPWAPRWCGNAGSQPDLHLDEEMVTAWSQVRTVRRVVENLSVEELDWNIFSSRGVWPRVVVQENDAFSEHSAPFFFIDFRSVFSVPLTTLSPYTRHNRRWISAALCPSVWRKRITAGGSGDDRVHVSSVITPTFIFI
jgi:hypothetical protein